MVVSLEACVKEMFNKYGKKAGFSKKKHLQKCINFLRYLRNDQEQQSLLDGLSTQAQQKYLRDVALLYGYLNGKINYIRMEGTSLEPDRWILGLREQSTIDSTVDGTKHLYLLQERHRARLKKHDLPEWKEWVEMINRLVDSYCSGPGLGKEH